MNAPLSKEQLARLAADGAAYHGEYVEGLAAPITPPDREGAGARWVRAIRTWIVAYRERRGVLNELAQMSDRDLDDIGLSRATLHRVFDADFARTRREDIAALERIAV